MNQREKKIIQDFSDSQNNATYIEELIGTEEGVVCMRINRDAEFGCSGIILSRDKPPCVCHLGMPPCSACTEGLLYCEKCEWEEDNA